jgi:hypothetical protein
MPPLAPSTGWVFLLACSTVFVAYFSLGLAINFFCRKRRGWAGVVPNWSFWEQMTWLVRDGLGHVSDSLSSLGSPSVASGSRSPLFGVRRKGRTQSMPVNEHRRSRRESRATEDALLKQQQKERRQREKKLRRESVSRVNCVLNAEAAAAAVAAPLLQQADRLDQILSGNTAAAAEWSPAPPPPPPPPQPASRDDSSMRAPPAPPAPTAAAEAGSMPALQPSALWLEQEFTEDRPSATAAGVGRRRRSSLPELSSPLPDLTPR